LSNGKKNPVKPRLVAVGSGPLAVLPPLNDEIEPSGEQSVGCFITNM
jgi:hypothetical protein